MIAGVTLSLTATLAQPAPVPNRPPNVVFILADDVGMECLRSYGGTSYRTPNLDAMARAGMQFKYSFACPECAPSRAELITGRYGNHTGLTVNRELGNFLDPDNEVFLGQMLQKRGYVTGLSGKWHLGDWPHDPNLARRQGFDEYSVWVHGEPRYWNPVIFENGKLRTDTTGKFGPDVWADYSFHFLQRHRAQPFFLYYSMVLPHEKLEDPPGTFVGKPGHNTHKHFSAVRFAENIEYMDKLVGDVRRQLDELGLSSNTVVFFAGDNGTALVHKSMMNGRELTGGKGKMTDAGSRVPLLVCWPGKIAAGTVCDDLTDFSDFVPTILDLTGAAPPKGVKIDGQSFAPQLLGQPGHPREWVYMKYGDDSYVRTKRWKYTNDGNLYDMNDAPFTETPVSPRTKDLGLISMRKQLSRLLISLR